VGVGALHPRTYGYNELHFSILSISIQEYARGINLKISGILRLSVSWVFLNTPTRSH